MKPNEQFSWEVERAAYNGRLVSLDGHRIMQRPAPPKTAPKTGVQTPLFSLENGGDQHV